MSDDKLIDKYLSIYNAWRLNITYSNLMTAKGFYLFKWDELEQLLM
jgi:hypothetical protein